MFTLLYVLYWIKAKYYLEIILFHIMGLEQDNARTQMICKLRNFFCADFHFVFDA